MAEPEALGKISRPFRGHYGYVLGSLLTLLAIYPFVEEDGWLTVLLDITFLVAILSCFLVSVGRRTGRIILALAVVGESIILVWRHAELEFFEAPAHLMRIIVLGAAMVFVLRDVLRAKHVTMDTVFAAASVYLLMALVWSSVYIALEHVNPGGFNLKPSGGPGDMTPEAQLVYFSLITLTTVGFGDITPTSAQASMLAALQGLIGQLFIAILLARLVAMELADRQKRKRNGHRDS